MGKATKQAKNTTQETSKKLMPVNCKITDVYKRDSECYIKVSGRRDELLVKYDSALHDVVGSYEGHTGTLVLRVDSTITAPEDIPDNAAQWGNFEPDDVQDGVIWYAYAYQDGEIFYDTSIPAGAEKIASARSCGSIMCMLGGLIRLGYKGEHLVPGIPEAADSKAKVEAFGVFVDRVKHSNPYKYANE